MTDRTTPFEHETTAPARASAATAYYVQVTPGSSVSMGGGPSQTGITTTLVPYPYMPGVPYPYVPPVPSDVNRTWVSTTGDSGEPTVQEMAEQVLLAIVRRIDNEGREFVVGSSAHTAEYPTDLELLQDESFDAFVTRAYAELCVVRGRQPRG